MIKPQQGNTNKEETKMKFKTTRKAIVNGASRLVSAGYCDLATLLRNHSPIAYNCGVYGWNFDVYEVYGLTICTGYRNMPGRRANNISEYESRAREIMQDDSITWQQRDAEVEKLLEQFCSQADA